jgi:hypothetical protein
MRPQGMALSKRNEQTNGVHERPCKAPLLVLHRDIPVGSYLLWLIPRAPSVYREQ